VEGDTEGEEEEGGGGHLEEDGGEKEENNPLMPFSIRTGRDF
jgi:hypothetical protein